MSQTALVPVRVRATDPGSTDISELTVLVPTRNERDNVTPLIERLEKVCPALRLEVLFVDDSTDDTPRVIREQARRSSRDVKLIHRPEHRRFGGLGGAVSAGLNEARTEWVCVMDADLQHPPELLAALVEEARRSRADVVVASRYCSSGDVGQFSVTRRAVSRGCVLFARALFPRRLREVSDPMSGFFLVRRAAIDLNALRPRGFKVLLEILLCGRQLATREVALCFGERNAGRSKASLCEGLRYVRRLIEIRAGARASRLAALGAVGAVGVAVNTGALELLARTLHVWYLLASVLATQLAIGSNYALSEWAIFRGVQAARSLRGRLTTYVLFNNACLALTVPVLVFLVSILGMDLLSANVLSLVSLTAIRFAVADAYIWAPRYVSPKPSRVAACGGRSPI